MAPLSNGVKGMAMGWELLLVNPHPIGGRRAELHPKHPGLSSGSAPPSGDPAPMSSGYQACSALGEVRVEGGFRTHSLGG